MPPPLPNPKETPRSRPRVHPAEGQRHQALQIESRSSLPVHRKYPYLEILRSVFMSLAAIIASVGMIWLLISTISVFRMLTSIGTGEVNFGRVFVGAIFTLVPSFACLSYGLVLMAISEGIRVILDIQSNTLISARALREAVRR
ncbi:hypothetical protein FYK55_26775 [Roseiconus nitratireducens]|uniref:Uncharacterized protein n=1 Tax=Roseiconus nitratireducens TaxID=2605748 RepID=A0A5M6CZL1_9BACT|nr:hypothetical protein [Roseiconus nitratireducens]KAA5538719.1 hypothetical protein FYK55_26775 [Roseiconus nitratireducens]